MGEVTQRGVGMFELVRHGRHLDPDLRGQPEELFAVRRVLAVTLRTCRS